MIDYLANVEELFEKFRRDEITSEELLFMVEAETKFVRDIVLKGKVGL